MGWGGFERYRDHGLLLLRLGFGLGFAWFHGWPKLRGGPERWRGTGTAMEYLGISFAPEFWGLMAGLAECLGGLLIALGLFTRVAAAAIAIVMLVATIRHWVTGEGTPAHSFKNFWVLSGLVLIGAGRFTLDAALSRRRFFGKKQPSGP